MKFVSMRALNLILFTCSKTLITEKRSAEVFVPENKRSNVEDWSRHKNALNPFSFFVERIPNLKTGQRNYEYEMCNAIFF